MFANISQTMSEDENRLDYRITDTRYQLCRLRHGRNDLSIVVCDGFLSQDCHASRRKWLPALMHRYAEAEWLYVAWDAKNLLQIGLFLNDLANGAYPLSIGKSIRSADGIMSLLPLIEKVALNPWFQALSHARETGRRLADDIRRMADRRRFILLGHSLGARVIYYFLQHWQGRSNPVIEAAYLLGGAVDRRDADGWRQAANVVSNAVVNCYSRNDAVLKWLYPFSTAYMSRPAGSGPIHCQDAGIINLDVSHKVTGHMDYKPNLSAILQLADKVVTVR